MLLGSTMPTKPTADRFAREAVDALVKDDGVEPARARDAVTFVLLQKDTQNGDPLKIYRAARRQLRLADEPDHAEEDALDYDDDARPTLVMPPARKPPRKGTRKDTPAAKKESRK
jgi:hypothetical protein